MLISLPGSEVAHHPTVPPGPHCPRVEPAALPGPGDIEVVLVPAHDRARPRRAQQDQADAERVPRHRPPPCGREPANEHAHPRRVQVLPHLLVLELLLQQLQHILLKFLNLQLRACKMRLDLYAPRRRRVARKS